MSPQLPPRAPGLDARLASMLELIGLPAILVSKDYRILAANRAYVRHYGALPAPGVDRCHSVSHGYDTPCDLNGERCPLRACLEQDGPARVTHVHHTPHGPEHCEILLRPVRGEGGQIEAFVETIRPLEGASAQPVVGRMLGRSRAFSVVLERLERAAPSALPVLLLGESGTGKELLARALHERSAVARGPFVPVECSGLTESLFESELFGYERGAFTGAERSREGLVDAARGGTLFLDEIGDVPRGLQVRLLRLLETGTFRRVGGRERLQADFRLVCATHRDLPAMVAAGTFRSDLLYRINAFPLRIPPLRERREDIALLSTAFLAGRKHLSAEAMQALEDWAFPGNVRELKNLLERAVLLCDGEELRLEHLPEELAGGVAPTSGPWPWGDAVLPLDEVERRYLAWAERKGGSREDLARHLGLSVRTLYRRLERVREEDQSKESNT